MTHACFYVCCSDCVEVCGNVWCVAATIVAFDTINHQIVLHLLEHSLGITDSALALMKSYLDGRQQCVQIEGVISELADLACVVSQGSVLGPLKFCIYMLPISSIMRHHDIYYHIYADDTQLYVSFDWSNPNVALDRMNLRISDLQIWMIRNKLKINNSKTEFLIITSSFLKLFFVCFFCLEDLYLTKRINRKHKIHSHKYTLTRTFTCTYTHTINRNMHRIDSIIKWKKIHLICLFNIDTHSCNIQLLNI